MCYMGNASRIGYNMEMREDGYDHIVFLYLLPKKEN